MRLSQSGCRRVVVASLAVLGLFWLSETPIREPRTSPSPGGAEQVPISLGLAMPFIATAYCKGDTTASGVPVRAGVAASDPKVLPEGSVVWIQAADDRYTGIYTVLDTGPQVHGHHVDLYIWSCYEATDFGLREVWLTVLRRGWDPARSVSGVGDWRPPED